MTRENCDAYGPLGVSQCAALQQDLFLIDWEPITGSKGEVAGKSIEKLIWSFTVNLCVLQYLKN